MTDDLALRRLEPELLDHLPTDDPGAIGSRRDLVWINALMLQPAIMAATLKRHAPSPPARILEIGAGDGGFTLAWAKRLAKRWPAVELTLLDKAGLVTEARLQSFRALGWTTKSVAADIFTWLNQPGRSAYDIVTANLFLHHFEAAQLTRLFNALRDSGLFVATEPRRNRPALWSVALLRLTGANDVTMHDAAASVRAGFRDGELSSLWPASAPVVEKAIGPFTHVFVAKRGQ